MDDKPNFEKTTMPLTAIPIIDFERLSCIDTRASELAKLHSVCQEWGVFQVINHGIAPSVMETLKNEIQDFYKLPMEEKMRYKLRPGDVEGYGQTMVNMQDKDNIDWADRFVMVINPIDRRKPHLLPQLPPNLREVLEVYFKDAQELAMTLLKLMGEALGIEKREVEKLFEDGMQLVRMTHYPPCPQPAEEVLGLRPHTDGGGLTILLQLNEVNGLEVKKDGVWIPVNVVPGAFVANIGDIMEIFSNGMYTSVEHRVGVNSVKERISMGMFFSPNLKGVIGPANCLTNRQNPPVFKSVLMENYMKDFFSRNLQIRTFLNQMKNINEDGDQQPKKEGPCIYTLMLEREHAAT